jgi:ribosomal protein S18 acetylase RimI-like enzyme
VLVTSAGPDRIRLVVERDGDVAGYVAVERQPDGNGYVDFLGVAPGHRRRGLGAELVRAGVAALAELGCRRFHLTVREADTGARALYAGLGFTEERVIRPFRRGFSLR